MSNFRATAVNPFAKSNFSARIPDGKCTLSVGTRIQQRKEFVQAGDAAMDVFLYPGINNVITIRNVVPPTNDTYTIAGTQVAFMPSKSHGKFAHPDLAQAEYSQSDSSQFINKWRTVSCGANISLVNQSDEDSGWFEAVRCSPDAQADPFLWPDTGISTTTGPVATAYTGTQDQNLVSYPGYDTASDNMVNQPSYVSGKLKDIHKYLFALNPHSGDHDFNNVGTGTNNSNDLYDQSHDTIYIRLHGTTGTRVLIHTSHNQEIMYDEESPMSKFHGPTFTSPSTVAAANRAANSRVGAGTLVRGNATTPIRAMGAAAPRRRIVRRAPMRRRMAYRRRPMMRRRMVRRRPMMRRSMIRRRPMYRRRVYRRKLPYGLRLGM